MTGDVLVTTAELIQNKLGYFKLLGRGTSRAEKCRVASVRVRHILVTKR
jgi:hypothetical protein